MDLNIKITVEMDSETYDEFREYQKTKVLMDTTVAQELRKMNASYHSLLCKIDDAFEIVDRDDENKALSVRPANNDVILDLYVCAGSELYA